MVLPAPASYFIAPASMPIDSHHRAYAAGEISDGLISLLPPQNTLVYATGIPIAARCATELRFPSVPPGARFKLKKSVRAPYACRSAVAAAMDHQVDVLCTATAGKLMLKGVAAAIRASSP